MSDRTYFIVGGAGFIGSHFTDSLLSDATVSQVTIYDNFSSGREWHFAQHLQDPRFHVIRGDVKDQDLLSRSMAGHRTVIHLASNPDIAKAATDPDIDFREGTDLTRHVVEAMRVSGAKTILYASGSGIYGDLGTYDAHEDYGPLEPVSTYGASKLAGEVLIAAYAHMFDLAGRVFRFGNVVGPRQTHGVGFDFLKQLLANPGRLRILGDGTQSKSYIHVSDVVNAVLMVGGAPLGPFAVFNAATGDYITVAEIADLAVECAGLAPKSVAFDYTGGSKGWKGDVPVVRLNTDRIRKLGWRCGRSSREALRDAMLAMLPEFRAGRL